MQHVKGHRKPSTLKVPRPTDGGGEKYSLSCSANSGNKPSEPGTSKTHRQSILISAGSEVVEFKRKYSVSGVKYFIGLPVKGEPIEKVYVVVAVYKWWPKCQLLMHQDYEYSEGVPWRV